MTERRWGQLEVKFRSVHALAKHHRPFTDFVWIDTMDKKKGVDVGTDYESDKSAREFAYHIAEVNYDIYK